MANHRAFGRRINPQALPRTVPVHVEPVSQRLAALPGDAPPEKRLPVSMQPEAPSLDRELEEWTRARKRGFKVPWRQLSLMASLCFGIGSFVLPDSVNDNVEWLLWGLAAMSAFVWFTNRKKKKLKDSAAP
jgi:hypothetical protein